MSKSANRGPLKSQDIRSKSTSQLLGHRVEFGRKKPLVEHVLDGRNPFVMEIVKNASLDASPIVDRHDQMLFPVRESGNGRRSSQFADLPRYVLKAILANEFCRTLIALPPD